MLDVRGLSKKYRDGFAFKEISFHIYPGDFAVLFGADDEGKTTLLYHILGMQHLKEGEILFHGRSLLRLTEAERKRLRFVPDSICQEAITVKQYLHTLAEIFENYDEKAAIDLCEYFDVNMNDKLSKMPYMKNKLAMIIGAMVTVPELLILDEPMNFLDEASGTKLLDYLKALASKGVAILITCESAAEVKDYCSHYLYLQNGQITHSGLMKDAYGSKKAITLKGGNASLARCLMGEPIAKRGEYTTYLFCDKEQNQTLAEILGRIEPEDFQVENLSIEEILNEDYTRWM